MPSYFPSNRFRLNLRELVVCELSHEIFCELLLQPCIREGGDTNYELIYMAYAIIQTGGKQYRVAEGDILDVEKLALEAGQSTTFTDILMIADGDKVSIGAPFVDQASVQAEVVEQWKGEKVIAFKFRRRKGYHRTVGHRRQLTKLKITSISAK